LEKIMGIFVVAINFRDNLLSAQIRREGDSPIVALMHPQRRPKEVIPPPPELVPNCRQWNRSFDEVLQ
jgi:hypothetical protein